MASGLGATATGQGSTASALQSTATGLNATASALNTTATGANSKASGQGSTAAGAFATAGGQSSTAVGFNSSATASNSAAFGAGAKATQANQMVFGTASNTYTAPGITSGASAAAQSGPLQIVTSDANGNLATDGGAFQKQLNALGRRDRELADGIAVAMAVQQPIFQPGQNFAMRLGYGNFDGTNAVGASVAGVIARNSFGPGTSIIVDGGVGFGSDRGTVAGKAGVTFGW
jgi:autotransporter adhesin